MENNSKSKQISVLGIDLAKNSFQLHSVNESGEVINKKPALLHRSYAATEMGLKHND